MKSQAILRYSWGFSPITSNNLYKLPTCFMFSSGKWNDEKREQTWKKEKETRQNREINRTQQIKYELNETKEYAACLEEENRKKEWNTRPELKDHSEREIKQEVKRQ